MSITINDGLQVNAPKSTDAKYLKSGTISYSSILDANTTVLSAYRSLGLTVYINGVEYWWKSGTADIDLIIKNNVVQVQADWTQGSSGSASFIVNKPTLALVATSGSYPDLVNKPTIPSQFSPIAGTNVTLTGTYPNITFNAAGGSGGSGSDLTGQTLTVSTGAIVGHLDKLLFLIPSAANLTYTINPATFTNKLLRVYAIPGVYIVAVTPSSGTIASASSYQMLDQECITIFSDGTNLFIIAKN